MSSALNSSAGNDHRATSLPFVKPRYDGLSIANIPDTVAQFLGSYARRPLQHEGLSAFGHPQNVVLLLLDGFGSRPLGRAKSDYGLPIFDRIFSDSALSFEITSVFPSTTSTAMSSLHTGLTPQEHGVIGYTMFIQEIGTIAQMLRFSPVVGGRSLFDLGIDSQSFFNAQTIHERLNSSGLRSTVYVPRHIVDSGLSRITNRGAFVEAHNTVTDMLIQLRRNLERQGANSFHFVYHPSPDTLAHAYGPYSEEYATELDSIFRLVEIELFQKLDRRIAKNTVLIVSGDHGAVTVPKDQIVDVADHQELLASLKFPPTGDSRASILHAKAGEENTVRQFFDRNFHGAFEVFSSRKILDEGYFGVGTPKRETLDRIGDLVAVPKGVRAIDNSLLDPRHEDMPGRHGGLSDEEMTVPCIVSNLG